MPDEALDANRLRRITEEMISILTSPSFVEAMRTLKSTPEDQRLKVGSQILTTESLRSKGVPLPADMRITSRYFESTTVAYEIADSPNVGQPPAVRSFVDPTNAMTAGFRSANVPSQPVMAGGCCCGGGATVCGGCGGSSMF